MLYHSADIPFIPFRTLSFAFTRVEYHAIFYNTHAVTPHLDGGE